MKRVLGNLALSIAALVVTLLLAEPVVRFFRPFDMNRRTFAMRYDPVLGWSKAPHLTGVYAPGERVEALNSRGLRGREYPYEKPAGEYRVLVLGDSFAEGRLVSFHDTTFEVLERELRAAGDGRRYEVISAGTGGYSTDQAYLFFEHEGRKYAPDVTVLMFYENDVWYNAQPASSRGNKPLFELRGGDLTLTRVPVPPPAARERAQSEPAAPSVAARLAQWLESRSAVYQFVHDGVQGLAVAAPAPESVPDEFRVWQRQYDDQTRYAWRVTEALLRALARAAREGGSEFVVLYVPTAAEVHPEIWEATQQRYGLVAEEWDITRLERELADVCRRNGIHFVDPGPAFRAEAARPLLDRTPLFFTTDPHWTPAGHAIAGRLLAEYVRQTFVPPS